MYNPRRVENMTTDEKLSEIIRLLEELSKKLDETNGHLEFLMSK